jgi:hypothetical protein
MGELSVANGRVEREAGGHFACMEMPEEMVSDMQEFFGQYYEA